MQILKPMYAVVEFNWEIIGEHMNAVVASTSRPRGKIFGPQDVAAVSLMTPTTTGD